MVLCKVMGRRKKMYNRNNYGYKDRAGTIMLTDCFVLPARRSVS